jgi:hypothetical protein
VLETATQLNAVREKVEGGPSVPYVVIAVQLLPPLVETYILGSDDGTVFADIAVIYFPLSDIEIPPIFGRKSINDV